MTTDPTDKALGPALAKVATLDEKAFEADSQAGPDDIVPGSEGVTHHELATLRHVADTIPYRAFLVVFVEFAERWSYYGIANLYNNYIRAPLPRDSKDGHVVHDRANGIAGALGLGQQKSFAIRTFNSFFVYITPILGGYIADTYLGRYKTIIIFSLVALLGHVILTVSAAPSILAKPQTALGLLVFAIVVIGIGTGAIKSNVSPLVAEQYTGVMRKKTLKSGEVVIVSPAITIQNIYNLFYLAINLGSCGAISASFLARDHSYWAAYLVPTGIFALVPLVMAAGKKQYVTTPPRGSILPETMRVFNICAAQRWSINPVATVKAFKQPGFWDPAKPSHYAGGAVPAKITWDDEFVGEVARTFKACKVFLFFPFYWLCYSQIDGNLSTVAAGMTLNGTPNDVLQNLNPIALVVIIPIMINFVYPMLRKMGINFSPVKRIYTGFLVAGLGMLYAAVLQKYIFETSPCHDNLPSACVDADGDPLPSPLNVWIVAGPYILVALSEVFASITSLEYAFTKAPTRMRSVVMAFSQFQTALSAALNFALVAVNVENKFTWLFGAFAVTAWVIGTIFFFSFRQLDRDEAELNAIGHGDRAGFADETPAADKA